MSDQQHDPQQPELETLFHEVLDLAPEERQEHLAKHCAGRAELHAELLSLLQAHDQAPSELEAPAWGLSDRFESLFQHNNSDAVHAVQPGSRVGHYEVQRMLGQGGMGAVYLALQREPLRRLVALKLIKPGMDTREVVRRFASERQALARLNHPGIAAVHDAGVTEQGRPYFVMEYVPGKRITDWCDARRLSLRERVELFVQVCRAMQHAHAQGIVHRDLKPGNVLVREHEGEPLPKIIDFGVAKAMVGRRGASTLSTRQGQVLGTPGYMSPEQAGAVDAAVDARSDVYSLGALLHELLTGVLPHERKRLRGASLATRLRETPPPASVRIAELGRRARRIALQRGLQPRQHLRAVRGDLEAILARSLEPQPTARYASVAALCADLTACLAGRAVRAPRVPRALSLRRMGRRPIVRVAAAALFAMGAAAWYWPLALGAPAALDDNRALSNSVASAALPVEQLKLSAQSVACQDGVFSGLNAGQAARRQLVLNFDDVALAPGAVVQLVGRGSWHGQDVLHVRAARAHDSAPLTGVLQGAAQIVEHSTGSHVHAKAGALDPRAAGVLLGAGSLARALVAVPAEGLQPGDALGPGAWPGQLSVHTSGTALLGFAAEAHPPGLARVSVWVQPQFVPELPVRESSVALYRTTKLRAGEGFEELNALSGSQFTQSELDWQYAEPMPLVALADAELSEQVLPADLGASLGASNAGMPQADGAYPQGGMPVASAAGDDLDLSGTDRSDDMSSDPPADDTSADPSDSTHTGGMGEIAMYDEDPPGDKQLPGTPKHPATEQAWFDLNGDELLDLAWRAPNSPPKLYVQVDPGRFEERSELGNFAEVWVTQHAALLDANGDQQIDLVGVDQQGNLILWQGLGDGSFVDVTFNSGLADIEAVRLQVIDVDADGTPDIQVELPLRGVLLLRNRNGVFTSLLLRAPDEPTPTAKLKTRGGGASTPSVPAWSRSRGDH